MNLPRNTPQPGRPVARRSVYGLAALVPLVAVAVLLVPGREQLRAAGPPNTGHEQLTCGQCHTPAEGSVRQQLQANARSLVGLRDTGADFVHKPVGNADCVACHQNEDDRHPVYRFNEPRFDEVRAELAPQLCVSCHSEHNGRRVTAQATICSSCHSDMEIKEDPIEPSHDALVTLKQWGTCLQCHDYHGNHVRTTPERLQDAATEEDVIRYLSGGASIYGDSLRFPARTERETP